MTEPIVFPDASAIAITWLADHLVEPVHQDIPNPRPETFVTVTRDGGPKRNIVTDGAQITVDSWGETWEEAHDLAQTARAWLNAIVGETVNGAPVYRCDELAGPGRLPDLSDQPRYRQNFLLAIRGVVLTGS